MACTLYDFLRTRGIISISLGSGMLLGAAGLLFYYGYQKDKQMRELKKKLDMVELSVIDMKEQFRMLRARIMFNLDENERMLSDDEFFDFSNVDSDIGEMFRAPEEEGENWQSEEEDKTERGEDEIVKSEQMDSRNDTQRVLYQIAEADRLSNGSDDHKQVAFEILKKLGEDLPDDARVLWRLARCYRHEALLAGHRRDIQAKKDNINRGLELAEKSLQINNEDPEAHKWMAILIGLSMDFLFTKDKILKGIVFREHVEKAIQLNPNDYSVHHLLGRFKLEICNLSWIEKKLASTFLAKLPPVTYSEALEDFLKAEKLSSAPWKENKLLIAKCFIGLGRVTEAVEWLKEARSVITLNRENRESNEEITALLALHDN